jgi:hypothetical protein
MPLDNDTLSWINIEDFTPGIRQRVMKTSGDGSIQPLGAADPTATYRCIALPQGGIGPLPKKTYTYKPAMPEATISRVWDYNYKINGFYVDGQGYANRSFITKPYNASEIDPVIFHISYEYLYDFDTLGDYRRRWRWEAHDFPVSASGVNSGHGYESMHLIKTYVGTTFENPSTNAPVYGRTSFTAARVHATDPAQTGRSVVVGTWFRPSVWLGTSPIHFWGMYPTPAGASAVADISTTLDISITLAHQGRILGLQWVAFTNGALEPHISNEQVWWTEVNLNSVIMTNAATFGQGRLDGYGLLASISASELMLIKHAHGALIISGDLDKPTVTSYPGVIGTNGADVIPTYSPVGLVYASLDSGIYAWQGGDTSIKLSKYMDDNFWCISDDTVPSFIDTPNETPVYFDKLDGTFDTWGDWVLLTGNWLYDTISDSWWLLDDQAEVKIFHWGVAPTGNFAYGTPITYSGQLTDFDTASGNTTIAPLVNGWDKRTPTDNYKWRSQVLAPTADRVIDVREVTILASGPVDSTVTITLFNEDGDSREEQIEITSTVPKLYRKGTQFKGTAIQAQVECDANNATLSAPVVFKIGVGFREGQRQLNSGAVNG